MVTLKTQLIGTWTLIKKELIRFWRVAFQTVAAPVITGMLYLVVFSHVLQDRLEIYEGVSYTSFLIPGLIMMLIVLPALFNQR
jgi:ABC-2 type transport system permease protein